jgi:putative integral membrane protein (TIGR02587 family)
VTATRSPARRELDDLVRAACGGMLFGIPLLYTMEVWWVGSISDPRLLLAVLAVTFAVVFLLNRTSGFRSTRDVRMSDSLKDSVEAVAIGLVCVFAILVLLREITSRTPLDEALGKIVYEATPFVIGVGMARHFLRGDRTAGDDEDAADGADAGAGDDRPINATLADVGATLLGAVFIAFNIAPTDEIPMITAALSPAWICAVVAVSLLVSYGIVFAAGFGSQAARREQPGIIQHPITETVFCYLIALIAAAAMLWFFQRWGSGDPFDMVLHQSIVLGLPAAIGGAAGRLVV